MLCYSVSECCSLCCSASSFPQYTVAWLRGSGARWPGKVGLSADLFSRDLMGPEKNGEVTSGYDEKKGQNPKPFRYMMFRICLETFSIAVLFIKTKESSRGHLEDRVFFNPSHSSDLVFPFFCRESPKLPGHRRDVSHIFLQVLWWWFS